MKMLQIVGGALLRTQANDASDRGFPIPQNLKSSTSETALVSWAGGDCWLAGFTINFVCSNSLLDPCCPVDEGPD